MVVWDAEAGLGTAVLVFNALYVAYPYNKAHQARYIFPCFTCKGFIHGTVAAFFKRGSGVPK